MAESVSPSTTPDPTTQNKHSHQRKLILSILIGAFLLIGLVWFFYWLIWQRFEEYTDDAYVNGNIVQLMSQVPGTVITVHTDDTYLVKQGQPIIQLDPTDMDIALQHAKAELASTVRQVRQYFENAKQAKANVSLRYADLMKAELDLKRRIGLVENHAISGEELEHYQTEVATRQAAYNEALYSLRASLALVEGGHLYTHPLVEAAKAKLKTAYINLKRTTIVAPVTGYVAKRNVHVGQHVQPNTPMLAIIPLHDVWVDANYKESQLDHLRIGQPVTLYADAYSDVTFHGTVLGLSAGTGAAFALLPPQNATGNWIKIVQRLPVRIALNAKELQKTPLQIGLSMHVTANTHQRTGHRLASVTAQQPVYDTKVYAHQLAQAQALIDDILQQNSPSMWLPKTSLRLSGSKES